MRKNERLIKADIYNDKFGFYHMRLMYTYEDEKGKHMLIYPRVDFPFPEDRIPDITYGMTCHDAILPDPTINALNPIRLAKGTCALAESRGVDKPSYAFDIITEYAVHEMTMDEIEEKLGYKVKIVNKEKTE